MARVPVLVLALVATTSSLIVPTEEHQREMKVRLAEASNHVRFGGPKEEMVHRARELVELHNGFVTDMIKEYRPSRMATYAKKVRGLTSLFETEESGEGRRLSTGPCFNTYGAEWGCVMSSCWCDRAFDDSESGDDISTSCDDSSEYSAYACDVSMLQTECRIESDTNCIDGDATQDDWVINFFTNGSSSSLTGNVDVIQAETGTSDEDACGGNGATSWSQMCCEASTCQYSDATCATGPYVCGTFNENAWDVDGPSFAPTYSTCADYGLGNNAETDIWGEGEFGNEGPGDYPQAFTATPESDAACPDFVNAFAADPTPSPTTASPTLSPTTSVMSLALAVDGLECADCAYFSRPR